MSSLVGQSLIVPGVLVGVVFRVDILCDALAWLWPGPSPILVQGVLRYYISRSRLLRSVLLCARRKFYAGASILRSAV
jgi:hypothetical protein